MGRKRFIHKLGRIAMKIVCAIVPKNRDQVLFYSKPDFSDNSRVLYEKFESLGLDSQYKVVWIINGNKQSLSDRYPDIAFYNHKTVRGFLVFCRSSIIFRSHVLYANVRSRRQKVVLIWHGMGIKGPMDHNNIPNFADYVTVTSDFYRYRLCARFRVPPSHCIVTGLPRNDYMFAGKHHDCLNALPKVAACPECKTILWVPTFHKNDRTGDKDGKFYELGVPILTWADLEPLNDLLVEKNIVLIIKLHPHVTGEGTIHSADYSNIQILEDAMLPADCSLYHLLGGIDAMLTDYSSMFTDFMLLDRPLAFIYDDFEEYSKQPGFAFERVKLLMPGVHINSVPELFSFIEDFSNGIDRGAEERRQLNRFINFYQDDNNCVRVLKAVGMYSERNDER